MREGLAFMAVLAVLVVVGCGKSDETSARPEQRIDALETRLADVEQSNRDLQTQLQKLEWQYAAIGPRLDALAQGPGTSREQVDRAVREALERQTADREVRTREDRVRGQEQAAERAARMQERQMARLTEALALTEGQQEQVVALSAEMREATRNAFAAMRDQGGFDRDNMQQVMQNMRTKTEEGMKKILSDEQLEKYQALPERERGLGWGMGNFPGQPRPEGVMPARRRGADAPRERRAPAPE